MSQLIHIEHISQYRFAKKVSLNTHIFRLKPTVNCKAKIEEYSLNVSPKNIHNNIQEDLFGNLINRVVFLDKEDSLLVTVNLKAKLEKINPYNFLIDFRANTIPFNYPEAETPYLEPYLSLPDNHKDLKEWLQVDSKDTLAFITQSCAFLKEKVHYNLRFEEGVQTSKETLSKKSGSCRDSSWLLIEIFRSFGIASRFVSGYLVDLNYDEPTKDNVDLHAWVEVYLPGAGWVGLDPTTGLLTTENYISLCVAPDFKFAAPISGLTEKTETTFSYSSKITRLNGTAAK